MPKPIPSSLAESAPTPKDSTSVTGEVMRVLGGIGLPSIPNIGRFDEDGVYPETTATSWQVATEVHAATADLFHDSVPVPELREFTAAGVDFAKLRQGFEAYDEVDLCPELVLAPVNLPLIKWFDIYSSLRQWQDANHPDGFKLQNRADSDGLEVVDEVADHWDELNQQVVRSDYGTLVEGINGVFWKVVVVPTASYEAGGIVTNVSHQLTNLKKQLRFQTATLERDKKVHPEEAHMPVSAYLTLQARLLYNKGHPLDYQDTMTWVAGRYTNHWGDTNVLGASWFSYYGYVEVFSASERVSDDHTGVRLPVWG